MGLIGEMRKVSGQVSFGGKIAYCAQTAWIQNATLVGLLLFPCIRILIFCVAREHHVRTTIRGGQSKHKITLAGLKYALTSSVVLEGGRGRFAYP